jgi:hypothetical protein
MIDMNSFKQVFVVALGKAAGPMLDMLLDRMKRRTGLQGIYCSNQPQAVPQCDFALLSTSHLLELIEFRPNQESVTPPHDVPFRQASV